MRLILLATLALSAASCAGPTIVVLKNPTTGEVHQCGQTGSLTPLIDSYTVKSCAEGYQAAGFQRMN